MTKCPYCARLPRAGWTETNCESCGAPTELPASSGIYIGQEGMVKYVEMLAEEGLDYQAESEAAHMESIRWAAQQTALFTQYT